MLGVELAVILNIKLCPTDCNLLDSKLVLQSVPTVGSKLGILEGKTHVNTLEANDVTTDEKKLEPIDVIILGTKLGFTEGNQLGFSVRAKLGCTLGHREGTVEGNPLCVMDGPGIMLGINN